jgi:predicted permease
MRPSVRTIRDLRLGDLQLAFWVVLASVFAVLVIACGNVANLLLARAAARREEMAVRSALGADRARLIRQTLTESTVLGIAGGTLGCGLAAVLLKMFAPLAATIFPRFAQARMDGRILLFTSGISAVSVLLFGLVPAFSLPKNESLAESRTTGNSRRRLAPILVSFQVAGALIMLTAAGLLLRTLWNIDNAPLGMQTNGIIVADVLLGKQTYSTTLQCTAFFDQLEQRAGNLPGVETLGVASDVPLAGGSGMISSSEVRVEGQPQRSPGSDFALNWRWVTPGFFSALKIHTLEGRVFREPDRESSDNLIVLNRVLAEKLFPNERALDRRIQLDPKGPWYAVIGVVDNVKNYEPTMPTEPEYYLLRTYAADPGFHVPPMFYHYSVLVIRGNLPVSMIAKEIRAEVQSLSSSAVVNVSTMNERLNHFTERQRFNAILLSIFGGVSLLLAAIGLFGVISFLVAQRTREIGVRVALGASPAGVLRLFLGRAARWVFAGAAAGLIGSYFAAHLLRGLLFGVPATDPLTWLSAFALLAIVAFLAAWIPARRAAKTDPIVALRYE